MTIDYRLPKEKEAFRRDLVDRLSRTDAARAVALNRGLVANLALDLGVREATLFEAARIAVMASANAGVRPSARCGLAVRVDKTSAPEVHKRLCQAGHDYGLGQFANLMRSLCHGVMLTQREPTRRPPKATWLPGPGSQRKPLRAAYRDLPPPKMGRSTWLNVRPNWTICTHVSLGLAAALEARSQSYGVARARYICLWIADFLDGFLDDVPLPSVSATDCFESAGEYVLPVRPAAAAVVPSSG